MAHYEHLPIYRAAMETALYFEQTVRHFSRYHKYSLGSELRQTSRDVVKLIVRANSTRQKLPVLHELRQKLEELKLLVRLTKEAGGFSGFKSFQHAVENVTAISRQNEGWIKSQSSGRGCEGLNCR